MKKIEIIEQILEEMKKFPITKTSNDIILADAGKIKLRYFVHLMILDQFIEGDDNSGVRYDVKAKLELINGKKEVIESAPEIELMQILHELKIYNEKKVVIK